MGLETKGDDDGDGESDADGESDDDNSFGSDSDTASPDTTTRLCSPSYSSSGRGSIRIQRMCTSKVQDTLKSFKFFQGYDASVVNKLSEVVKRAFYPAGTVLFRQGDPGSNCYLIASGQIGVFVHFEADRKPSREAAEESGNRSSVVSAPARRWSMLSENRASLVGFGRRMSEGGGAKRNSIDMEEVVWMRTAEGFSYYHADSNLGTQVASLPSGTLVGELALLNDAPRTASLKTLEDTSLIVIPRADFSSILKTEMERIRQEKLKFLLDHVPGMTNLPYQYRTGKVVHPSYHFFKCRHPKGYEFIKQDGSPEDAVYIVIEGVVEVVHRECGRIQPTTQKSLTPASRSDLVSFIACRRHPEEMIHPHAEVLQVLGDSQRPGLSQRWVTHTLGTLQVGGIFGSLLFVDVEPFSFVAKSAVEVWTAKKREIRLLPKKMFAEIKEHLMQSMSWHVKQLRLCRAALKPLQPAAPPSVGKATCLPRNLRRTKSIPPTAESKIEAFRELGLDDAKRPPSASVSRRAGCPTSASKVDMPGRRPASAGARTASGTNLGWRQASLGARLDSNKSRSRCGSRPASATAVSRSCAAGLHMKIHNAVHHVSLANESV